MNWRLPLHLKTGLWGERQAESFLTAKGFTILSRRFCLSLRDELDLVARDGQVLVFIEVKTRKTELFGRPLSAVDRRKRHFVCRAAIRYLERLKAPTNFRFDVVEVIGREGDESPVIRHIENAFPLDRCYVLPW